jgi:hypothetical protein
MRCIVCYNEVFGPTILVQWTRCRKGLITYLKTNNIIAMAKHMTTEHPKLFQKLFKEVTNIIATLTLGSWLRQGLAKVQAKNEAWESHFMLTWV